MPKVLITGGTGFVGYHMQQTAPSDMQLTLMSRRDYFLEIPQWFSDRYYQKYDYIVHLAPVAPNLVIKCAQHSRARLLYASSGIVYHPEWDTEYRRNKMAWEKECLEKYPNTVIARLFTFCGEKLTPDHAYPAFEQAAKDGKPIRIWGDGFCIRSYMHGEEMGRQLWAILLRGKSGEAYDIGSDEPVTMLELAQKFSDNVIIENRRPDPMPCYLPTDTAKTRALLK